MSPLCCGGSEPVLDGDFCSHFLWLKSFDIFACFSFACPSPGEKTRRRCRTAVFTLPRANLSSPVWSVSSCYRILRRCICITTLGRFSTLDISDNGWNSAGVKELDFGNISPEAFRRRIVRYWHPLGGRAIDLGEIRAYLGRPQSQKVTFGNSC